MYTIGHQAERGGYTALRDVLMQNARTLWSKTKDLATGKAIIQGDTMEEVWALKDVSFEIHRGEAMGIIGRNGAGKSTLLKVLSRITEPSTGRVTIKGRVASLLEVGTGFHPELSGRENIYLNGTILGMTRVEIKQKFDEIVAFAEVEKYLDTPVKRYSSGMYVRLAFAVAAHLEPEILVVDEVLAVGDVEFQKKCLGKMGKVAKEGRTVLFVSHNMAAINRLCKQCLLLEEGQVRMIGTTESVIPSYLSQGESISGLAQLRAGNKDSVIIHEIGIINSWGKFSANVEVNKDFFIWVKCTIKKKLRMAQICIAVLSTDGNTVFVTTHIDSEKCKDYTLSPKTYQARVRVPGNFLNVGTYSINVRILGQLNGEMRCSHAVAFMALTFRVEETGSVASKLFDRRRGVVTPILDWAFE